MPEVTIAVTDTPAPPTIVPTAQPTEVDCAAERSKLRIWLISKGRETSGPIVLDWNDLPPGWNPEVLGILAGQVCFKDVEISDHGVRILDSD